MRIAIVGCGYVADFYMETLPNHPALDLVAACDIDPGRREAFAAHYRVPVYESVHSLLEHSDAELLLNLTDPRSHHAVSRACLEAGRHLFSEKPLTMDYETALELVQLADSRGLSISGAPSNVLSETADAVRQALASGEAGVVRAVFAEMSVGSVLAKNFGSWRSVSGSPWPYADEFELGDIIEHSGYCLALLVDLFGPVERVLSFSAVCYPDKHSSLPLERLGPDLGVAALEFRSGVVARLTCNSVATRSDRSLHIIGDKGTLTIEDVWRYDSPVYLTPLNADDATLSRRLRRRLARELDRLVQRVLPGQRWHGRRIAVRGTKGRLTKYARMDYARGPAAHAEAIRAGQRPRISAELLLHVTEIALAMQHPGRHPSPYLVRSPLPDWPFRQAISPYLPRPERCGPNPVECAVA
jgi:predicted dehydrogenase